MSTVMVTVHVPAFSKRRAKPAVERDETEASGSSSHVVLGVPTMGPAMRDALNVSEEDEETRVLIHVAALVREFITASSEQVGFISEIPYMNGQVRWSMFMFSCKASFAEECMKRLGTIGIGSRRDGIGIVNMLPVHLQRFSTEPSPDGTSIMFAERMAAGSGSTRAADAAMQPPSAVLVPPLAAAAHPHQQLELDMQGGSEVSLDIASVVRAASAAAAAGTDAASGRSLGATGSSAAVLPGKHDAEGEGSPEPRDESAPEHDDKLLAAAEHIGATDAGGTVHFDDEMYAHEDESGEEDAAGPGSGDGGGGGLRPVATQFESFVGKFGQTVRSRVAVDSVVELVNASAEFSFDYMMLVFVASMLAAIGLITNNPVVIVASMLVSPLMGPILAVTFGATLRDRHMVKMGLMSELVGLCICLFVGFIGGLCAAPVVGDTWPTREMWSRSSPTAVYIGISIAIPSGVGVALSVLGNNTSSLVGVAISASLLPPAVNTGILLAMAALINSPYLDLATANTLYALDRSVLNVVDRTTIMHGAGWSLLLTVANIICIWISGILMFKLKEVAPLEGKSDFWTTHVPRTREYNAVLRRHDPEAKVLRQELQRQLTTLRGARGGRNLAAGEDGPDGAGDDVAPTVYTTLQAMGAGAHAHWGRMRKAVFNEEFFQAPGSGDVEQGTSGAPAQASAATPPAPPGGRPSALRRGASNKKNSAAAEPAQPTAP